MIKKSIPIILILASVCLFLLSAHAITSQGTGTQFSIDQLKQQASDYIKQNNMSDANMVIKTILTQYLNDARQSIVVYDLAEACRNSSKFVQSIELYKFILQNYSKSSQAMPSQRGIVVCSIALRKLDMAKKELEILKSNYSADPNLSQALF